MLSLYLTIKWLTASRIFAGRSSKDEEFKELQFTFNDLDIKNEQLIAQIDELKYKIH